MPAVMRRPVTPTGMPTGDSSATTTALGSSLGRRGMLAAIAGSTVGLAVLISGCADDSVDEAVQKAQSNATLPDAKLTPKQPAPSAALDTKPWRTGGPSTASKAEGQVATAQPIPEAKVAAEGTHGSAQAPVAGADRPAAQHPSAPPAPTAPPAPGEPTGPVPQPTPPTPAPDPAAPVPPTPPPPPPPPPGPTPEQLEAMHKVMLLNRVTYGPTPQVSRRGRLARSGRVPGEAARDSSRDQHRQRADGYALAR